MLVISGQNTRTNGWGNQLPVAHARTFRGHVPFRHFRSYNFRSLPIRASSSDVAPPQIWLENLLYTTLVSLIRQLHSVMLQCKPKLGPKISRKLYFLYNVNDLLLVLIINTDLYSLTVLTIALWIFPIIKWWRRIASALTSVIIFFNRNLQFLNHLDIKLWFSTFRHRCPYPILAMLFTSYSFLVPKDI
jgi:hypothetical protein